LYVPTWLLALGLALSLFGATLSAAGLAAFLSLSRARLRHLADDGIAQCESLLHLAERPVPTAAALAAADVLLSSAVLGCAAGLTGAAGAPAAWLVVGPIVLLLIVGHAIGSAVAVERPERVGLALARFIRILTWPLLPLVGGVAARLAQGLWGTLPAAEAGQRELQKLVEVVEENAALEAGEQKMIHGIVELGDRTVREIMVPRIDMVAVAADATVKEVLERIRGSGHSRIPVYGETIDNVVGVLYAKDLLHQMPAMQLDAPVRGLVRPAYFVPETKRVDELLHELQEARVHIVIVVDEYGGTAGLITIEDLLEEIVGEIRDEYDVAEETWIEPIDNYTAVFDARVSIHDVNQTLPLNLDDSEYDTLGGLVYARLGKVPAQGDEVHVDNALVSVLSTVGRRVQKVRVAVEAPPTNGKNGKEGQ
jgi:magnesium and cobalt exporter, CNNM family